MGSLLQLLDLLHEPPHADIQTEPAEVGILTQVSVPPGARLKVRVHDAAGAIVGERLVLDSAGGEGESASNLLLKLGQLTFEVLWEYLFPFVSQLLQCLSQLLQSGTHGPGSRTWRGGRGGGGRGRRGRRWGGGRGCECEGVGGGRIRGSWHGFRA